MEMSAWIENNFKPGWSEIMRAWIEITAHGRSLARTVRHEIAYIQVQKTHIHLIFRF
jgi:hypothetical protein